MPEPNITTSFISYLRQASRVTCTFPGCNDSFRGTDRIRDHVQSKHPDLTETEDLDSIVREFKRARSPVKLWNPDRAPPPHPKPSSPPRRSRSRPLPDDILPSTKQRETRSPSVEDDDLNLLIKQPETRPISQEQLVAEVKGIYAGLLMVESKCIEVDNAQSSQNDTKLNNEQWQALIALHRTLLHEHHDFLLASQHPSASQALRRLALKYAMPARESMPLFEPMHPYEGGGREDPIGLKHRRGRGARRNNAYWKERNDEHDTNLFDDRELLFQDEHGSLKASRLANLDTQLKIQKHAGDDLVMSAHCARDLGLFDQLSTDFNDPCLQSISGHSTAILGVLRNVQFRLKGSSVTFRRDFWVCESLNNIVDVMIGANFIKDNFKMLFAKVKDCISSFATWFSKKKETPEQKKEREERERQQQIAIKELEIKRLQKETEALRRASARNDDRQQGGVQSDNS